MNTEEKIKALVEKKLRPDYYELINDSAKHIGHAGDDGSGQTHFKLKVVSPAFADMSRLERHRYMNDILEPLFDEGLHAIVLNLSAS